MTKQELKTQNNQLINWMAFRKRVSEEIEDVKKTIKNKTETERAKLKGLRNNVSIATFKIEQLYNSLEEQAEAQENVSSTLTLEDFDGDRKPDINLAEGEYKASKKKNK